MRLERSASISAFALILASLPLPAVQADVLAEFFFWDRMGAAAGLAAESIQEYRAIRQDLDNRIAEAEAAVARCGGCPEAQAELRRWKSEEYRLEDVVGSVLASTGTPPAIADFLDIPLPPSPGRSLVQQQRECAIVEPAWAKSAPAACQAAVDEHLACLREYEASNGLCSSKVAREPGAACWDTRKLFLHCANEDIGAFEREVGAQALRRSDPATPEYVDHGRDRFVLYPHAPSGFQPQMPPENVILEAFESPDLFKLEFSIPGAQHGVLRKAVIQRFHWSIVGPNSTCFSGQPAEDEVSRRICDDLYDFTFHHRLPVLACWYSESLGRLVPDALFWYGDWPDAQTPSGLLERAAGHPILRMHGARTACPANADVAEAEQREHIRSLAGLGVEQIPESVRLPTSALREREVRDHAERYKAQLSGRLDRFPIEGYFSVSSSRDVGTRNVRMQYGDAGHCSLAETGKDTFSLKCASRRGKPFGGTARREPDGLVIAWSDGTEAKYSPSSDGTTLQAMINDTSHFLRRIGPFGPERLAELASEVPFEGRYRLEVRDAAGLLEFDCGVERQIRAVPNSFQLTCYTEDGAAYRAVGHPTLQDPVVLRIGQWSPQRPSMGQSSLPDLDFPLEPALEGVPATGWEGGDGAQTRAQIIIGDPSADYGFGTPLEKLPDLSSGRAATARAHDVRTIEQLAALSDADADRIGIGWIHYRNEAKAYLGGEPDKGSDRIAKGSDRPNAGSPNPQVLERSGGANDRLALMADRISAMDERSRSQMLKRLGALANRGHEESVQLEKLVRERLSENEE